MGKNKASKENGSASKPVAEALVEASDAAQALEPAPEVVRALPGDDADGPDQPEGRPVLSLMLAVALAITVFFAVQAVGEVVPQAVTIGLSILSLAGLIALFGALAGFVHFGRTPRQKAFFDKLLDASIPADHAVSSIAETRLQQPLV